MKLKILFLIIITTLFSCKKESDDLKNCVISEIKDQGLDLLISKLSGDKLYNIKSINDEYFTTILPKYYNGKLVEIGEVSEFQYDKKNRIVVLGDMSIQYDENDNIIYIAQRNDKYEQYFKFYYNDKGNVIKVFSNDQFYGFDGKEIVVQEAKFDSLNNPYYQLPTEIKIFLFREHFAREPFSLYPILLFSKNNFTSIINLTEKEEFNYTQKVSKIEEERPIEIKRARGKSIEEVINISYNCE